MHAALIVGASTAFTAPLIAPVTVDAQAAPPNPADTSVRGIPVTEVPAHRAGDAVVVFLTGDGGFAELDREVASVLADSGISVVALDTRAYLWRQRTPDETARDVARVARHYAALWHRDRIVIAGYSHGADLVPYVADRLPADVAPRVVLYAMAGLGPGASFQFHFADLFRDIRRPTDLPVMPQLQKLRGRAMLCIYGTDEAASSCRDADSALVDRRALPGDHHFNRAYRQIGAIIASAILRR